MDASNVTQNESLQYSMGRILVFLILSSIESCLSIYY
jgi:hypothetical protein